MSAFFHPTEADHASCQALVHTVLIESAKTAHGDAVAKLNAAEAALKEAVAKQAAAEAAAEDAASGRGTLSPVDAETALASAEIAVRAATRVRDAAQRAAGDAEAAIQTATADAHRPVSDAGLRLRVQACVKAERAQTLLAEAQREYGVSGFMLNVASANGAVSEFDGEPSHRAGMPVRPVAEERPHWARQDHIWAEELAKLAEVRE